MSPESAVAAVRGSRSQRRVWSSALLWLAIYVAVITLPLFALLPVGSTARRGFFWDFAMALGYAALVMFGLQFALTARFRRATAPFGIDIVYHFHRYLAVFALLIVMLHYLVLRADYPLALGAVDPRDAPLHMTAGRFALLCFVAVTALSLTRRALRIDYYRWRVTHALLAAGGVALALSHLLGSGHYLDRTWKQALWVGYGTVWLGLIVYVRIVRPWLVKRAPYRVTAVRSERGNVWTLVLERPHRQPLQFSPGQFAWLTLRASPFAMHEHPFSIASSAEHSERIELSVKALGDFTSTIRDVAVGEAAWLDAPYGAFSVDRHADAGGYVFLAGGIGVAPIMSMLRTLADRGDRRPLLLFYGNRVWERVAFRDELETLQTRLSLRVVHVLIEPAADWRGEQGFISQAVLGRHLPARQVAIDYFVCGPTPMTRDVEHSLAALGVPAASVHSEIFDWV